MSYPHLSLWLQPDLNEVFRSKSSNKRSQDLPTFQAPNGSRFRVERTTLLTLFLGSRAAANMDAAVA